MYIVVGLGNPGEKYVHTRHNVGFDTIDILSRKWGIALNKLKHKALFGEGNLQGERVILSKPQTFMNSSGESVVDMVRWYKIPLSNLIVIYDDIDLGLGKIRIRRAGSAGTHNGMRSIIYQLQDDQFPRVRIGVGAPPPEWDLVHYVLSRFSGPEEEIIFQAMTRAAQAVETMIVRNIQEAMNAFNG